MPELRVVIYAAKSTADKKGSIPDQIAACLEYAEAQGWTVDGKPETDESASGYTGNRGKGLARAQERTEALATKHGSAGLLVMHSNRLARGAGDATAKHLAQYLFWARGAGIDLHSVEDDFTFQNPVMAAVMGEMAHQESKIKGTNVRKGMERRAARGLHTGGSILGYDRDPDKGLTPNGMAPTIRRIFQMVAAGKSQVTIARTFNDELKATGAPKPLRAKTWQQASIGALLQHRTYLGEVKLDGEWSPAQHEPIIDRELWDAAHAKRQRAARSAGRNGGRRPTAGHLLSGRTLRHADCASAMTPVSNDPQKDGTITGRYICAGAKEGICAGLVVDMEAVDEALLGYLAEVGIDADETLRLIREASQATSDQRADALSDARSDLAALEEQRDRLWSDRKAGDLDADDWRDFKAEYDEQRPACEAKIARLEAQAAEAASAPEEALPQLMDALALVRSVIDQGDRDAIRTALDDLFSGFLIGRAANMPGQAMVVTEAEAAAARAHWRARIEQMEKDAGRTVAEGNAEFWAEEAAADADTPKPPKREPAPLPDGLVILPQPRPEAMALTGDGEAVQAVDERGRPLYRRVPLRATSQDGLTR